MFLNNFSLLPFTFQRLWFVLQIETYSECRWQRTRLEEFESFLSCFFCWNTKIVLSCEFRNFIAWQHISFCEYSLLFISQSIFKTFIHSYMFVSDIEIDKILLFIIIIIIIAHYLKYEARYKIKNYKIFHRLWIVEAAMPIIWRFLFCFWRQIIR